MPQLNPPRETSRGGCGGIPALGVCRHVFRGFGRHRQPTFDASFERRGFPLHWNNPRIITVATGGFVVRFDAGLVQDRPADLGWDVADPGSDTICLVRLSAGHPGGGYDRAIGSTAVEDGATPVSACLNLTRTNAETDSMWSAHLPQQSSSSKPKNCLIDSGEPKPARAPSTASATRTALHTQEHRLTQNPICVPLIFGRQSTIIPWIRLDVILAFDALTCTQHPHLVHFQIVRVVPRRLPSRS